MTRWVSGGNGLAIPLPVRSFFSMVLLSYAHAMGLVRMCVCVCVCPVSLGYRRGSCLILVYDMFVRLGYHTITYDRRRAGLGASPLSGYSWILCSAHTNDNTLYAPGRTGSITPIGVLLDSLLGAYKHIHRLSPTTHAVQNWEQDPYRGSP